MSKIHRRDILSSVVLGASAAAISGAFAEDGDAGLVERLRLDIETHASYGDKISGGPGDLATADWTAGRLKACGFEIERAPAPAPYFESARSDLILKTGETIPLFVPPVAILTSAAGLSAPIRLIRSVSEAPDAKGAIAVVVLPFNRHAAVFSKSVKPMLDAALAAKPAAVIISPTGPTGEIIGLNTRAKALAPVPIAIMAPKHLPAIEAVYRRKGGDATLCITGEAGWRKSVNIIARRKRGPRWLVVSTPRTGWFNCVGERGVSTAAFLHLCDWAARRHPDLSVFAISSGSHEFDFTGMHEAMPKVPPPENVALWAHIGAGLATRSPHELSGRFIGMLSTPDPERILMTTPNISSPASQAFKQLTGYEKPIDIIPGAGELGAIVQKGYERAFACLGVHRWFHTRGDNLEKVDASLLAPVVTAHQDLITAALGDAATR